MSNGWQIEWHEELDSTNRLAVAKVLECWAQEKSADGIVIIARRQSGGRGQHGRKWASPAGGLYLSAVMTEEFPSPQSDRLALVAGVAVADALSKIGPFSPTIRWPNDLLLDGKKVCGILCEGLSQFRRWAVVMGIGVNVNTRLADLPPELRETATSLVQTDGRERHVDDVAHAILVCLREELSAFKVRGLDAVLPRARSLDGFNGKPVRLLHRGTIVEGIGAGISGKGELRLLLPDGARKDFADGSISAAAMPTGNFERLFRYAADQIRPDDIICYVPSDPGTPGYIRRFTEIWETRTLPAKADFDITETVSLTLHYCFDRAMDPVRFRRFRVFTSAVGMALLARHRDLEEIMITNYLAITLLEDVLWLQDLSLLALLTPVLEEFHNQLRDQNEDQSPFLLLALLLAQIQQNAAAQKIEELALELMREESKYSGNGGKHFLWSATNFDGKHSLWKHHVSRILLPSTPTLALLREALLDHSPESD